MIRRRKTRKVKIGNVEIGGDAPISIQSMTKTDTRDVRSTLGEIVRLKEAGCEIVRIAVRDREATSALKKIVAKSELPIEADIHFLPQLALEAIEAGVAAIRVNPGNIRKNQGLENIIKRARDRKIPMRVGVNSGSLKERRGTIADSMVRSALDYIKFFEKSKFRDIIISLKSSDVLETIDAYRKMSRLCDYPFHVGITAAGPFLSSAVKSGIGIGTLLQEGIGDTIRVSLTGDSIIEVEVAKEILSAVGIRSFGPEIISCPTCGRCDIDLRRIVEDFRLRLNKLRLDSGPSLKVAIMGCVVNGPGEAKEADVGVAGGKDRGILFRKGRRIRSLKQNEFVDALINEIEVFRRRR